MCQKQINPALFPLLRRVNDKGPTVQEIRRWIWRQSKKDYLDCHGKNTDCQAIVQVGDDVPVPIVRCFGLLFAVKCVIIRIINILRGGECFKRVVLGDTESHKRRYLDYAK